jgi:hypothetical protein
MKQLIVWICAFVLGGTFAHAQVAATTTIEQEVQLREGVNQVPLRGSKALLKIMVRQDQTVAVSYQANANSRPVALKAQDNDGGTTSGNQDCPCGHKCWEDEALQMSICVCKSCGKGGFGKATLFMRKTGGDSMDY